MFALCECLFKNVLIEFCICFRSCGVDSRTISIELKEFVVSRGLVHRNLCAKNVMIDECRGARVGDFASTRPQNDEQSGYRFPLLLVWPIT